jgi:hypothetical protein
MTNAEQYFIDQMKDPESKEIFYFEKIRLDIEYQLDDLKEKVKTGKSKSTLIRGVNKIKRTLVPV